jgi:hypothetical protein
MKRVNHRLTRIDTNLETPSPSSQIPTKSLNGRIGEVVIALILLATFGAGTATACDMCAVYASMTAQGVGGKGFFAGVVEQYIHEGTLQNNGQEVANPTGQYFNDSVATVFAGYHLNSRLDLQFNIPVIYRAYQRPIGNAIQTASESGVGDVSVIGNLALLQKIDKDFSFTWSLLAGVKFPTGDTARLNDPEFLASGGSHSFHAATASSSPGATTAALQTTNNGVWSHQLALGSGSLDGVIGTGISTRWQHFFFNAGMQYSITTEGAYSHQYANDLTWQGGPGYYFLMKEDYTLALEAVCSGDDRGNDTYSGIPDGHSALTIVYLGPQINFTWTDKLSALLAVDLPVSIYNSGSQTVPDYKIRASVRWNF